MYISTQHTTQYKRRKDQLIRQNSGFGPDTSHAVHPGGPVVGEYSDGGLAGACDACTYKVWCIIYSV